MLKKPIIITGLDIGSSKISAVALEAAGERPPIILGYEAQASKGVAKGAITGLNEASDCIGSVLTRLGEKIHAPVENIYTNISADDVKGERSRGMIPLSSRGREVTRSDIDRCVNAASTIRLTFDREIIHRIVLNFSIDDQPAIKSPLGLYASRLSCEMYMITANLNHIQNIYKCVDTAGYDVKDVIYSGVADSMSVIEDEWKEEGVMLLNAGTSLTEVSIFSGGNLNYLDVIPQGANDIKGPLKESPVFNDIVSRIKARSENFKSIVVTGGLAFNEGVVETLEECLARPVRMGAVRNLQGNISGIDSLRGITAIGLARCGSIQHRPRRFEPKGMIQGISDKVTEIFNNYF